jgi:hypothetical protein
MARRHRRGALRHRGRCRHGGRGDCCRLRRRRDVDSARCLWTKAPLPRILRPSGRREGEGGNHRHAGQKMLHAVDPPSQPHSQGALSAPRPGGGFAAGCKFDPGLFAPGIRPKEVGTRVEIASAPAGRHPAQRCFTPETLCHSLFREHTSPSRKRGSVSGCCRQRAPPTSLRSMGQPAHRIGGAPVIANAQVALQIYRMAEKTGNRLAVRASASDQDR